MSFDWSNYLKLAQYLKDEADQLSGEDACYAEACYRSAVSRAYYGVYCQTRNLVRDVDKQEFYSDDHQALQNYLINHPHSGRSLLGRRLRELHQERKKADYDDNLMGKSSVNKASRALKRAGTIQEGLDQLRPRHP